jgi:NADH-quinone oxidoreductase subunit H
LFFGGWNGPFPITHWLGLADSSNPLVHYLANFLGMLNFVGKCTFGVTFMMWVRWTLPRLRIDQVMTTCLKYCTPIAAVTFAGAVVWTYLFPGGLIVPSTPYGNVREARATSSPLIGVDGDRVALTNQPGVTRGTD